MSVFTCENLRTAVITAALLFVAGLLLQLPRALFGTEVPLLTTLLSGIGLAAMVASPMVMLLTALVASLPPVSRRLETCNR